VSSRRDALLALTPMRRATSLTPSASGLPPGRRALRSARSTAATGRPRAAGWSGSIADILTLHARAQRQVDLARVLAAPRLPAPLAGRRCDLDRGVAVERADDVQLQAAGPEDVV
jgi:hypothetical protein